MPDGPAARPALSASHRHRSPTSTDCPPAHCHHSPTAKTAHNTLRSSTAGASDTQQNSGREPDVHTHTHTLLQIVALSPGREGGRHYFLNTLLSVSARFPAPPEAQSTISAAADGRPLKWDLPRGTLEARVPPATSMRVTLVKQRSGKLTKARCGEQGWGRLPRRDHGETARPRCDALAASRGKGISGQPGGQASGGEVTDRRGVN
ncbi:hypothetical protein SKAU_G00158290 [Synaphobranchus kaupii]|uniref:Uncharacterized protein n=1 Tax=Synaphobranchus kaupii TaxID=118154 RepID=A0A9Q1FIE5_SYNKA|nr:hypothetical protein SKAU_G00158290 [Synaphobranchus kaupii]